MAYFKVTCAFLTLDLFIERLGCRGAGRVELRPSGDGGRARERAGGGEQTGHPRECGDGPARLQASLASVHILLLSGLASLVALNMASALTSCSVTSTGQTCFLESRLSVRPPAPQTCSSAPDPHCQQVPQRSHVSQLNTSRPPGQPLAFSYPALGAARPCPPAVGNPLVLPGTLASSPYPLARRPKPLHLALLVWSILAEIPTAARFSPDPRCLGPRLPRPLPPALLALTEVSSKALEWSRMWAPGLRSSPAWTAAHRLGLLGHYLLLECL